MIEKGSEVGAHILSGAILDPIALDELIPDWKNLDTPVETQVRSESFSFLTSNKNFNIPNLFAEKNEVKINSNSIKKLKKLGKNPIKFTLKNEFKKTSKTLIKNKKEPKYKKVFKFDLSGFKKLILFIIFPV